MVFEFPLRVRYMEVDAQGVVFNGWYLTYFDEAMAAFLAAMSSGYAKLIAEGFDTQLAHAEIDWMAGLRWQDEFTVAVSTASVGRTSFTLDFEARRAGRSPAAHAGPIGSAGSDSSRQGGNRESRTSKSPGSARLKLHWIAIRKTTRRAKSRGRKGLASGRENALTSINEPC